MSRKSDSQQYMPVILSNLLTGGAITYSNNYSVIRLNQTTAGQVVTLTAPTIAVTDTHSVIFQNIGTVSVTVYGRTVSSGQFVELNWDGVQWEVEAGGGSITTLVDQASGTLAITSNAVMQEAIRPIPELTATTSFLNTDLLIVGRGTNQFSITGSNLYGSFPDFFRSASTLKPDGTNDTTETIGRTGFVGIGTFSPTNTLHVFSASNPIRAEGVVVSSSAFDRPLVIDGTGVVKTSLTFSSNFKGYLSTNFTFTTPVINKIIVQVEQVDISGEYNNTTGLFTPLSSGVYEYEVCLTVSNTGANNNWGDANDRTAFGLVNNTTGLWVARWNADRQVDPRTFIAKGVASLTAGTSYYFGVASATSGGGVIVSNPTGSTGLGIGTYFSIQRLT